MGREAGKGRRKGREQSGEVGSRAGRWEEEEREAAKVSSQLKRKVWGGAEKGGEG